MTRFLVLLVAVFAAGYALGSLVFALTLADVVLGAVVSAVAFIVWGFLSYRDEQRHRMAVYRERVWRRRLSGSPYINSNWYSGLVKYNGEEQW